MDEGKRWLIEHGYWGWVAEYVHKSENFRYDLRFRIAKEPMDSGGEYYFWLGAAADDRRGE